MVLVYELKWRQRGVDGLAQNVDRIRPFPASKLLSVRSAEPPSQVFDLQEELLRYRE